MSVLALARKELRLHRFAAAALFCGTSIALLGGAAVLPRTWSCDALITIDAEPAAIASIGEHLRDRLAAVSEGAGAAVNVLGSEIAIRVTANSAEGASERLNGMLARVVSGEVNALRERMRENEGALAAQVDAAAVHLADAEQQLATAQRGLPAGGESALGARIGQLQGERDALALDLKGSAELRRKLMARIVELDREIAKLHEAPPLQHEVAQQRIDTDLRPQRNQAATRLATLRDEIAVKEKRRREVVALLDRAQGQAVGLVEGNQAVRELQRVYDDAVVTHRQLRVRLQSVRDDIAVRATAAALPFRITRRPMLPERPDGIPAWIYVAAALSAGVVLAGARLLGRVLIDDKVRLAETIVLDAEVPVLAVVADYRPPQAVGQVRWPVIGTALLTMAAIAACLLFLLRFG